MSVDEASEATDGEAAGQTGDEGAEEQELDPRTVDRLAYARRIALAIATAALENKAQNVEIIDVVGKVDYADYVVVMSGRSDRQVASLAKNVSNDVKKSIDLRALSVEGLPNASWVLMDFGDVIVHIFHQDTRGYYDLEALWIDAPRLPVPE